MADQQGSAKKIIQDYLAQKGLGTLAGWAWDQFLNSGSIDLTFLQIQERDEYKQRFRGRLALADKGRAISEDEQIAIEQQYANVMKAAGMPAQFYDNWDDFQDLIGADKSPAEVGRLVNEAYLRVTEAPPEIRATMAEWYGPGSDSALAAYILDPNRALPAIMQQVAAAEIGGELARQGMQTRQDIAERVARTTSDQAQIRERSQDLARLYQGGLFDELAGETDLTTESGVLGVIGADQQATAQLERRIQERKATTGGKGEVLQTQTGVGGAGAAPKT
jgi:hypothetical protein